MPNQPLTFSSFRLKRCCAQSSCHSCQGFNACFPEQVCLLFASRRSHSTLAAVIHTAVTGVLSTSLAADMTGPYVRQLLEPAVSTVPAAADIPNFFKSAVHSSGTSPFPFWNWKGRGA